MTINSVLLLRVSSVVDKDVDHPQFIDPSYPLKYLQAGLERYQDTAVHILDCWIHPMGVAKMLAYTAQVQPDLIVISASSFDIDIANDFVSSLKKQNNRPLVIGIGQGHYLKCDTNQDEDVGYDAILLGEPEKQFFNLFDWIRNGDQSNISWQIMTRPNFFTMPPRCFH